MKKNAVIVHLFHDNLWDEISFGLKHVNDFDLYISIHDYTLQETIDKVKLEYPDTSFRVFPNAGRDIKPFVHIYDEVMDMEYQYICKVHTKKSLHLTLGKDSYTGQYWRKTLFEDTLVRSGEIMNLLDNDVEGKVGLVGSSRFNFNVWADTKSLQYNYQNIEKLAQELGYKLFQDIRFIGGSMFWVRHHVLDKLIQLLMRMDFGVEKYALDGTLAHSVERMFGITVYNEGLGVYGI